MMETNVCAVLSPSIELKRRSTKIIVLPVVIKGITETLSILLLDELSVLLGAVEMAGATTLCIARKLTGLMKAGCDVVGTQILTRRWKTVEVFLGFLMTVRRLALQ